MTTSIFSSCDFAAGWASGICGLLVGHPLDTIKVWKQTIPEKTTTSNVVLTLFRHEGIKGFYKGLMFPLLTAGALNSLFFGVYGNSMRALQELRQLSAGALNSLFFGVYGNSMRALQELRQLSAGALNSLFFGVYGNSMRALQELRQVERTVCWNGEVPYAAWHWDVFYSGCVGGFVSVFISCPVELIKTQMQTQTSNIPR